MKTIILLFAALCASAQTQVDYNTQIKNGPGYLSDATYTVLSQACTAAGNTKILSITKRWLATPTQTLCAVQFMPNGRITMATNAVLAVGGSFDCPVYQQCLDSSASGASVVFGFGAIAEDWITWFGADPTESAESSRAIQASFDACFTWSGSEYIQTCTSAAPVGNFKVSTALRGYGPPAHRKAYNGFTFRGQGMFNTRLKWHGASIDTVLTTIGVYTVLSDFQIQNQTLTGWRSAWDYDGDVAIGISSVSHADNLYIEGSGYPGDGITMGRSSSTQSDSLTLTNPHISGLPNGICLHQIASNTQGLEVQGGDITKCWQMWVGAGNTNQAHFANTNIVLNGLDFFGGQPGSSLSVDNVRSERSKRTFYTSSGSYYNPTTFTNFFLASNHIFRSATTTTAAPGAQDIVLVPAAPLGPDGEPNGLVLGDFIVITGADTAGADLHTQVTQMTDPTHAHIADPIVTGVTTTAITYDSTVQQYAFLERGNGPYVHIGGYIQTDSGGEIEFGAQGTQAFTGVGWKENITNPANNTSHPGCPGGVSWTGLYGNGEAGTTRMNDFMPSQGTNMAVYPPTIYMGAKNTSVNNVIVGGDVSWCKPPTSFGLIVTLRLNDGTTSYSLRAGQNSFNFAGNGAEDIKKMSDQTSDLTTAIAAGSTVVLLYIPTKGWVVIGT